MFQFQHIGYLYALAVLPLLVLLFTAMMYWRKKKIRKLGDERLIKEQILGYVPGRSATKFILLLLALFLIIVGWANLRMGDKSEKIQRKGVDVIICGHMASDSIGVNLLMDELEKRGVEIMSFGGFLQNHDTVRP